MTDRLKSPRNIWSSKGPKLPPVSSTVKPMIERPMRMYGKTIAYGVSSGTRSFSVRMRVPEFGVVGASPRFGA